MPFTAITCLLLSFAIAILVDILLSRYLLQVVQGSDQQSRIDRFSENTFRRVATWSLNHTLKKKSWAIAWLLGALTLFCCAILAFTQVPTEFFPETEIHLSIEGSCQRRSLQAIAHN